MRCGFIQGSDSEGIEETLEELQESFHKVVPAQNEEMREPSQTARADECSGTDKRTVSFADESGNVQQSPPPPSELSEAGAWEVGSVTNTEPRAWLVMKRLNVVQYDWRCIEVNPGARCFYNKLPTAHGSSEGASALKVCCKTSLEPLIRVT